jgi:hypothetical protein
VRLAAIELGGVYRTAFSVEQDVRRQLPLLRACFENYVQEDEVTVSYAVVVAASGTITWSPTGGFRRPVLDECLRHAAPILHMTRPDQPGRMVLTLHAARASAADAPTRD